MNDRDYWQKACREADDDELAQYAKYPFPHAKAEANAELERREAEVRAKAARAQLRRSCVDTLTERNVKLDPEVEAAMAAIPPREPTREELIENARKAQQRAAVRALLGRSSLSTGSNAGPPNAPKKKSPAQVAREEAETTRRQQQAREVLRRSLANMAKQ